MGGLIFGVNVSPSVTAGADPVADAKRAEALGFEFVSVNDHLHGPDPRYETWTLLSWIGASTSRIRVLPRVLALPYRSPAVVAKMAESFDRLSNGRLILGVGAGYSDEEFAAFGLPARSAPEKITALEEGLRIVRGLWTLPTFTSTGEHYRMDEAQIEPKPAHNIPIWLGTLGNRALRVTGRHADGWIPSLELAPPDRIPSLRARIDAGAREAGRDPSDIRSIYNVVVDVGGRPEEPSVLGGSPEAIAERLASFVELGFTGFNFISSRAGGADQIERLAKDVVPAVRGAA
jgi:alkanesulfonate monooxygenase SsuD/methylene tetrahydromethanopterin reductase-like flavin-dependent oxidoreductase (luciferase family)